MKFHIVDKDLEVIDSSNNMLELRLDCKAVNERIYDSENQCVVMSDREFKTARLVDYDINDIKINFESGDTSFLSDVLSGNGFKPYGQLTDDELEVEYNEMLSNLDGLTA